MIEQQEPDVEEEIFSNFIRKATTKDAAVSEKPFPCIPLLLYHVKRLDLNECRDGREVYHAFDGTIAFRKITVWGRMVSPIINKDKYYTFILDDRTALITVRISKNLEQKEHLHELKNYMERKQDYVADESLKHMRDLLDKTAGQLEYANLKQFQSVLIYGVPTAFHDELVIQAYAIRCETHIGGNIMDFDIAYRSMLIDWYDQHVKSNHDVVVL